MKRVVASLPLLLAARLSKNGKRQVFDHPASGHIDSLSSGLEFTR